MTYLKDGRECLTLEEVRAMDHDTANSYKPEEVFVHLDLMSRELDTIRNVTEVLKDRQDIGEDERDIAEDIFVGLEGWSELLFDPPEGEKL